MILQPYFLVLRIMMTFESPSFKSFFSRNKAMSLAKACNFIKRIRQLDPFDFFVAISFGTLKLDSVTLNSLSDELPQNLSRTGIHRRFTEQATTFMKAMAADFMAYLRAEGRIIEVEALSHFTAVNIIDSTSWKLPAGFADVFPGYKDAGCKVQIMFDYLTGAVNLVDLMKQTVADQSYARVLAQQIQPGALYLFDMGYTVADALFAINESKAFFLSRFNIYGLNLYRQGANSQEMIDLLDEIENLSDQQAIYIWSVLVGNKTHKTPGRLILTRMPEEIASRLRQKKKQAAKKSGKTATRKSLCLCDWGLWITNIPESFHNLKVPQLLALYPLRWSVELFFKQMKSTLKLHQTTVRKNTHRLTCEVLGACIVAIFITFCYSCTRSYAWRQMQREVSFDKTVKHFRQHSASLVKILYHPTHDHLHAHMTDHLRGILRYCLKTRQKSRTNSLDELIQPIRYQNYQIFIVPIDSTPRRMAELDALAA